MTEQEHLIGKHNEKELLGSTDNESFNSKVMRELHLLNDGVSTGFVERAKQAADHPGLTGIEIASSSLMGAGLTIMREAGGKATIAATAAGYLLGLTAIADVARRAVPTWQSLGDNWHNDNNYEKNKNAVAANIGSALFDYPLMAASGAAGSMIGKLGVSQLQEFKANQVSSSFFDEQDAVRQRVFERGIDFIKQAPAGSFSEVRLSAPIKSMEAPLRPYEESPIARLIAQAKAEGGSLSITPIERKGSSYLNASWSDHTMNYGTYSAFELQITTHTQQTPFMPIIPLPLDDLERRLETKWR